MRRRQILDAAEKRFREAGLHSTKMADVAAEAGVSVGMIYQYFPSKDALVGALILEFAEDQLVRISKIFGGETANLHEAMTAAPEIFESLALDHDRTTLMLEIAAETARNPKLRHMVSDMREEVQLRTREKVARLKPPEWSFEDLEARFDLFSGVLASAAIRYATEGQTPTPELLRLMKQTADWLFTPPPSDGAAG